MHFQLFAVVAAFGLTMLLPARAQAACCQQACCEKAAACCEKKAHVHEASPTETPLSQDPQLDPAPPVRQIAEVWFMQPTIVGRSILQGRYVIEHDNDRMARGEPCTHVYAFADQQNPVAAFHCTHLERDRANQNQVVLATMPDGRKKLIEFQFAGEHAAHGYPSGR